MLSLLVMSDSAIPWTVVYQTPLSKEFSWQEYWSSLPFSIPRFLPVSGIKLASPMSRIGKIIVYHYATWILVDVNIFFYFNFFIFLILKTLILTCVPKHEPPSHLPPYNISLGHPHAPAPSMLYPASDIDWRFDSYMIVYMLECHSPKSSHPLPLRLK